MGSFFYYILLGTIVTIGVTLVALPFGLVIGLLMALVHTYGGKVLNRIASVYSILLRGVPPIVLLFILYFILSGSIDISPFWAGSLSLGIVSSAYQMEIFRGALLAVGSGQMTAARAVGMSRMQAIRHVVLPQALRIAIPAWSNEYSIILKDSALAFVIGAPEIMARTQFVASRTYQHLPLYLTAGLLYFLLTWLGVAALRKLEHRLRIPGYTHHGMQ